MVNMKLQIKQRKLIFRMLRILSAVSRIHKEIKIALEDANDQKDVKYCKELLEVCQHLMKYHDVLNEEYNKLGK